MAERNLTVDVAKGLGILSVVIGHINGGLFAPVVSWVYLFHVPFFFFLSGLFLKTSTPFRPFLLKKVKRLYGPAVLSNALFLILYILMLQYACQPWSWNDSIRHLVKIILGLAVTPLGGATWFLIVLFRASILFCVISRFGDESKLGKKGHYLSAMVVLLLGMVGLFVPIPYGLGRDLVALLFLYAGRMSFKLGLLEWIDRQKTTIKISVAVITFILLLMVGRINSYDMSQGEYGIVPLMLFSSFCGILFLLVISSLVQRFLAGISRFLAYSGEKTMWILIGHFVAFKLIVFVQVGIMGAPRECVMAHPTYMLDASWPILYLTAGFFLPLLFSCMWNNLKGTPDCQ